MVENDVIILFENLAIIMEKCDLIVSFIAILIGTMFTCTVAIIIAKLWGKL